MANIKAIDIPYSIKGFSGASRLISVPSSSNWNLGTADWTISAIIKTPSVPDSGGTPMIIHHQNGAGAGGFEFFLNYPTGLPAQVRINRDNVNALFSVSAPTLTKGAFHEITVSRISNSHQVYVDGLPVGSPVVDANTMDAVTGILRLGCYATGSFSLNDGAISRIRINKGYGYTSTDAYNAYFNKIDNNTGLVLDSIADDGFGTRMTDISGQGLHGTITGALVWSKDTPQHQSQNNVVYSEDFSQTIWSKINVTPSAAVGVLDPFGGYNASIMTEFLDASPLTHVFRQVTPWTIGQICTFSVFLKKKDRSHGAVYSRGGGIGTYIDLTTGILGTKGGATYLGAQVEDYDNGWWRIGISFVDDGGGHSIYMANADGGATYQGNGTSGTYIFGAQVDLGLQMQPYRKITNKSLDVSSNARAVLKQNLLANSQVLTSWSDTGTPTVTGGEIAPDGTATAFTIADTSAAAYQGKSQVITVPKDKSIYTFSFRIKKQVTATAVCGVNLVFSGGTGVSYTPRINPQTGADNGSYSINKKDLGNYWEYEIPLQNNGTNDTFTATLYPATGALPLGSGDSLAAIGSVVFWQPQLVKANWIGHICATKSTPLNEGSISNIAPQFQNLLIYSDPANSGQFSNISNATVSSFAWPSIIGVSPSLVNATIFGDNSVSRSAYNSFTPTKGMTYTLSFYVKMDDGSVPVCSTTGGTSDFIPVMETVAIQNTAIVTAMGDGVYKITTTYTATGAGGFYWGVAKFNTNSVKTFKASGFQLVAANWSGPYKNTSGSAYNFGNILNSFPQAQNLVPTSNLSSWTLTAGVARTLNSTDVTDPAGGTTSTKIAYDGSGTIGSYRIYVNASRNPSKLDSFTTGIWLRTASGTVTLRLANNKTVGSAITITPTWQKFTLADAPWNSPNLGQFLLYSDSADNSAFTVYAYHAQATLANHLGAFIETTGRAYDNGNILNQP